MKKHILSTLQKKTNHAFKHINSHRPAYFVLTLTLIVVFGLATFAANQLPNDVLGLNSAPITISPGSTTFNEGTTQHISIKANTGGSSVNGIQIFLNISGAIPSVMTFTPNDLTSSGLRSVANPIVEEGANKVLRILFITSNPTAPFATAQDIELGKLSFTAPASGQMVITAVQNLTKILDYATGENLAATPAAITYTFNKGAIGGSNSENMTINNTLVVGSKVGIGTSNPLATLHVKGNNSLINFEGENAAFMQWFPKGIANGRKAWTGYGSPLNNDFSFSNEAPGGNIAFRTTGGKMIIDGLLLANDLILKPNVWADYVFEDSYDLKSLVEVEKFIKENKHLPGMPNLEEVIEKGVSANEIQQKFLAKIEELTLYAIAQEKRIAEQERQIQEQRARIATLEQRLAKLEAAL